MNKVKERIARVVPFFFGAPVLVWQILFLFIPLALIIALSVVGVSATGVRELTLKHLSFFLQATYVRIIFRSLIFALINVVVCFIIAYPIAYFLAFKARRFKNLFLFAFILPFGTNFLLHIYAWFFVFEPGGFLNSALIKFGIITHPLHILNTSLGIALMMIYYYLPFMTLPIYIVLEKFDYGLIEASLDLGATRLQTLKKIMLPITLPGILSGFFLVFVPSFAEFAIPELLGGDKKMFVGTVISRYVLSDATVHRGAAFTLIGSAVIMSATALLYRYAKKTVKRL